MRTRCSLALATALGLATLILAPTFARAQRGAPAGLQRTSTPPALRFYYMGPATGGRIASVVGVPGDGNVYYLGNASGGLYKTTDGAKTFVPIFDDQDVAAIGTLALAPSDPNTVWVGTGEPWVIRASDVEGDGVYKSSDGGATWGHMGLEDSGRIARIVVHPTNPNIVFVCSEGHLSGEGQKGVYRSDDGGANWKRVLYVDPKTSCSGLALDPQHPDTMLAGMWTVEEHTWAELSGGNGSGVYASHDGGASWTRLTQGLPHAPVGKVEVAIAPSNGQRMYALMQTADQGSLWRSDDAGASWQVASWDRSLIGRAGYYFRMAVNPQNPDEVLISSSGFHRSLDGGHLFSGGGGFGGNGPRQASCGDCHDIWMDPKIPGRYALTQDGGSSISTGSGEVLSVSLPNGQMYHVASDNRVPYWVYSNRQDNGTWRGPSTLSEPIGNARMPADTFMPAGGGGGAGRGRGRAGAEAPAPAPSANGLVGGPPGGAGAGRGRGGAEAIAWQSGIGGCESGFTVPDPTDADIVWASCYGNKLTRYDAREGEAHSVEPWMISLDSPPNEAKYRCHWTAPVAIDPFNHNIVYYGCQMVLKTSDQGDSWTELSPDLSTQDPSRVISNGGIEGDNLGQFDGEVVWAIAPSPIQRGLLWAGTNDGKLWFTREGEAPGAAHWSDVTRNIPGLPAWATISQVSPSSFDPGTAYIAVDGHLVDNRNPYIFKTTDFGASWKNITSNLPTGNALDYVMSVAENPNRRGMLFAGTAHAFFYSMDDGANWQRFNTGLPPAPVSWINVEKRFHDVDISTYGRGLFILPDITTLEQTGSTLRPAGETKLFAPGPIFRKARSVYPSAADPARPQFQFNLAEAPAGPVKMEILDDAGKVIRTQELAAHAGLNGLDWDLHLDGPALVALRTTPPENPHIWDELRFKGQTTRPITHWGITPTTGIPVAAPGSYQVRITVDGHPYTQPFQVLKDPAVMASDSDLRASTAMQVRLRDDISETSNMVNRMEVWRKQLEDRPAAPANTDLDHAILEVEHQLVTEADMLTDDKHFPVAYKVYMNLIWTSGAVGQGASDEAGGLDYKPTQTQLKAVAQIERDLATAKAGYDKLTSIALPAYNRAMAGKAPAIEP
ncbi:MAG TPA: hypothetical protein VN690_04820 [Terriglobales bacterium]|nr:hypothetical protein [Terriglobales bacterium]